MWSAGTPFLGGVFAPTGTLDDGRLSGRWSYASGSRHADFIALGALAGKSHVVCVVPVASLRIHHNWDTLGLAGTGSHDVSADRVRVAPDHVCSVLAGTPWPTTRLYRVPIFGVLAVGVAACGLGIAGAALARRQAARGRTRGTVATARGVRRASRELRLCTRVSARGVHGRVRCRGDLCDGARRLPARSEPRRASLRRVVRGAFHLGGGASMHTNSPLNAALRDIETLLTHKMVVDRVLPAAARALLGIGTRRRRGVCVRQAHVGRRAPHRRQRSLASSG